MGEQLGSLDVAALTDIGLKRKRNEDFCEYRIPAPNTPQYRHGALFVVADGMGGMGGGDVASQTAVKTLLAHYYGASFTPSTTAMAILKSALDAANAAVREKAQQVNLPRIGSTASGVILMPDGEALIFNVGDARVYRIRQNFIEQLSHDQSVLQHQIDAGVISEEQARQARNVNVTAFIGQESPLEPVYRRAQVQPDDIFLMCSDGLWDLVEPHEMLRIVQQYSAEAATRRLVELARKRGAPDNVTVIVLRIGEKPHQPVAWWQMALALLVLAVIAAIIWFGLLSGDDDGGGDTASGNAEATASASAVAALLASDTPVLALTDEAPGTVAATSSGSAVVILPTDTPTITPTPDVTDTSTPSATPEPSETRAPTTTHTPSVTPTLMPSATRTPRPTQTATQTATRTPEPSPTLTRTPRPSATSLPTDTPLPTGTPTPVTPTATLNPDVISPTPSPLPSPTPTLNPAEMRLFFAAEDGVVLQQRTALYLLYTLADGESATITRDITLAAGTRVKVISDEERPHPANPDIMLREVEVLSGVNRVLPGWIDTTALETAAPIAPYAVVQENGANLRKGDSLDYDVLRFLQPGALARVIARSTRTANWYRIELLDGRSGWVYADNISIIGDTSALPALTPPPLPTLSPTMTGTPGE